MTLHAILEAVETDEGRVYTVVPRGRVYESPGPAQRAMSGYRDEGRVTHTLVRLVPTEEGR